MSRRSLQLTSLVMGTFSAGMLLSCNSESHPGLDSGDAAVEATTIPAGAGAIIPPDVSQGDTVGNWQVVAADLHRVEGRDSTWVGEVHFSGLVSVSGTRRPHPSDPELETVCFFPDSASAEKLPRLAVDERVSWFCFSNPEAAITLDSVPTSPSAQTITIDAYRYMFYFSDVFNTARILSSISRF